MQSRIDTNWSQIRKLKMGTENFSNIATRGTIRQIDVKTKTLRYNSYITRGDFQPSTFCSDEESYKFNRRCS